ncbi:MAG: hypothetical protein HYU57_10160 [Micavibrio aeruginosavorus]|nr:hypothetical protein [Micavibrio aeruginosavorus]
MRSERLTRKTHLRRLSLQDDLIDLTLDGGTEQVCAETLWTLEELQDEALCYAPESVQEGPCLFESADDALIWCARMIDHSPTARRLMETAAEGGWSIGLGDLKNEGFCLDADNRRIVLDHFSLAPEALARSAFFRHVMLTTFIRALRDIWHEDRFDAPETVYAPEHVLMLERVRVAECDTVTILCGWELRAAGFSEVWRHLLGSEEGDMAIIFTRFLERDPGALFSGAALAYAFRQWYADVSRVDGVDHDTLENLDAMIESADRACPFGQCRLDPAALEDLATLPDGTRYLSGLGAGIMRDPFFAGLNDPINQTHFFHLMYDMEVVMVNNVPFRDSKLARRIFPEAEVTRVR